MLNFSLARTSHFGRHFGITSIDGITLHLTFPVATACSEASVSEEGEEDDDRGRKGRCKECGKRRG